MKDEIMKDEGHLVVILCLALAQCQVWSPGHDSSCANSNDNVFIIC